MRSVDTDRYVPRISALIDPLNESIAALLPLVPTAPWSKPPEVETHLILQTALFVANGCRVCDALLDHTGTLWNEGRMEGVTPLIRLIYEYWGAVVFANDVLRTIAAGNVDKAAQQSARLLMGSRSDVLYPWGEPSSIKSYSVMEFIRRLQEDDTEALPLYDFMCEATHPSFFQHSYFHMASKNYKRDDFPSDAYLKHADGVLERTMRALEKAIAGLCREAAITVELAGKPIALFKESSTKAS